MNDDWRLRIEMRDPGRARGLLERLDSSELEHKLEASFRDRVIVSRENSMVFCYTGAREQAEGVEQLARRLADEHGWELDVELRHWHPAAESWEEPDKPLPSSDAERAAEHAELIARERSEPQPEFEVRVECSSGQVAREVAERLAAEGIPNVQRASYVLVGAPDEDSANALAERLRAEAPADSTVTAEGTAASVLAAVGPNPFAIFGGLGG
jgi:rhodanese-related sulfurtransferase